MNQDVQKALLSKISYYRKGIKNVKPDYDDTLSSILETIKSERYKEQITQIREATDKDGRSVLKEYLDYYTFSGSFKKRSNDELKKHSGLICIDFDDIFDMDRAKEQIKGDKYTLSLFTSPSGKGFKVLVMINPDNHLDSFLFLEDYYITEYDLQLDKSCKDVARACFASYDPNLFINTDAVKVPVASALTSDRNNYDIDFKTGDVIAKEDRSLWDDRKKKDYERIAKLVDKIEEESIDLTTNYADWFQLGAALATFGEEGRSFYHRVSQFHEKYSQVDCDLKFTNAIKTTKFTNASKFFALCKEHGIKLTNSKGEVSSDLSADNYSLPDGVDYQLVKNEIHRYGFFQFDNKMWRIRKESGDKDSYYSADISNFRITPLGHIHSKVDPRRLLEIKNIHGHKSVLEVPTKAFTSPTEFTVFVEGQGNFQYDGVGVDLKKIRSFLYDNMHSFEEVQSLGWKDGVFIFANGVYNGKFTPIDEYGFVRLDKKNFYIQALSSINYEEDGEFEDEKKFVFVQRDVKLKDWAELYCKVHKDNGKISLCYFMASLFRDYIYNRFKFFPHLFLFGPPGTGKSQIGWSIRAMGFNGIKKPFNLSGGTKVAFHREFSHFTNFPCWFDEYDNNIDYDRVQALKAAYDGAGHKKSVKDSESRTKTVPVNSACIISGQQLPTLDNALFKRVILCQFYQTEFTKEEADLHKDLEDMQEGGLSHITAGFMHFRKLVEEKFLDTFEETLDDFREAMKNDYNVEDRIMRNMVICVSMFRLLEPKIGQLIPFTYAQLKEVAIRNIRDQMKMISNTKETNQFWDMVQFLYEKHEIAYMEDFKVAPYKEISLKLGSEKVDRVFDKSTKLLFLRTAKVIPLYRQYFKSQNSSSSAPMDKNSLLHYLEHSKEYVGKVTGTRFKDSNTNAYVFNYEMLQNEGVELEKDVPEHENPYTATPTKEDRQGDIFLKL